MKRLFMCSAVLAGSLFGFEAQAQQKPAQGTAPQQAPREGGQPGAAQAAPVQGTGTQIRGEVIRSGGGEFIVRGADKKEMVFRTNPETRYFTNNKASRFDDIRVGTTINAWYGPPQNDQYYANTVHVLPADGATTQVPAANNTFYEGQVVRVVGNDQVVLRTADGKEVTVFVNPQTTYQINDQPAAFNQFQVGLPIRVEYSIQNDRPIARGIISRRR
jgi:hypothetical protein